jgi:hypothetical protein
MKNSFLKEVMVWNSTYNQLKGFEMKSKNKLAQKIVKFIDTYGDEDHKKNIILADGLEEAFIGLAYRGGGNENQVAVYGVKLCISTLQRKNKWSREEAEEYLSYNIEPTYVGKYTPIFVEEMGQPPQGDRQI